MYIITAVRLDFDDDAGGCTERGIEPNHDNNDNNNNTNSRYIVHYGRRPGFFFLQARKANEVGTKKMSDR